MHKIQEARAQGLLGTRKGAGELLCICSQEPTATRKHRSAEAPCELTYTAAAHRAVERETKSVLGSRTVMLTSTRQGHAGAELAGRALAQGPPCYLRGLTVLFGGLSWKGN